MRIVFALVVLLSLALPSSAFAHVGKTPPVATDFHARITQPVRGIETKVVDGDQTLWLDAGPHTVAVDGIQGEPLLRFDRHGVWLNLHSVTAQTDRIDRFDLRPDPNPHARPLWHKVAGGRSYMWHEHRLHLLEPLAKGLDKPAALGSWTIPLVVDGRREALQGVLEYRPPPSALTWIGLAVALAIVGSLAAWRSRRTTVLLALTSVPVVWALRIARELYGRPTVGVVGRLDLAITSVVGVALVYGLVHRDRGVRVSVAFFTAFGALYQALTMYTVLTRADALTDLPTWVIRVAVALTFGLGGAVLAGSWNALFDERNAVREREPRGSPEESAAGTRAA